MIKMYQSLLVLYLLPRSVLVLLLLLSRNIELKLNKGSFYGRKSVSDIINKIINDHVAWYVESLTVLKYHFGNRHTPYLLLFTALVSINKFELTTDMFIRSKLILVTTDWFVWMNIIELLKSCVWYLGSQKVELVRE